MSHLGRPTSNEKDCSLEPIIDFLEEQFNTFVHFSDDCISKDSFKISSSMLPKEIHLLNIFVLPYIFLFLRKQGFLSLYSKLSYKRS